VCVVPKQNRGPSDRDRQACNWSEQSRHPVISYYFSDARFATLRQTQDVQKKADVNTQ